MVFLNPSVLELEDSFNNVQIPNNVLSILGTEAGLHLLAFGDETLQLRFAYKLNDTLNRGKSIF